MKVIVIKFMLLLVLVAGAHAFYTFVINPVDREEMIGPGFAGQVEMLDERLSSHPERTVVFFSDSVNWHHSPDDFNASPISVFMDEKLPDLDVVAMDHKAFHPAVYSAYVDYILNRKGADVALLLVSVNLRSFSTHFSRNWSWQFEDLQRYLRYDGPLYRLSFRPFRTFRVHSDSADITEEDFMGYSVYDGDKKVGKVSDYSGTRFFSQSDENLRDKIIFYYMQSIKQDHPRLLHLKALADCARVHGQRVLFYITPVDYQACNAGLGARYQEQIRRNVEVIKKALASSGCQVLDLSEALDTDYFYYGGIPAYPNEHLNEAGRRRLSDFIVNAINDDEK